MSEYSALQMNFRHAFGHGLTFQAAYMWSHNIDDSTTTYFSTSVDDNYDLSRWRGTSDLNRTQVLVMNYVYDLPFFKNASHAFVKGALGGWQISGITSFFGGMPVESESANPNFNCSNVVNPATSNTYNTGIGGNVRCYTVGPLKIQKGINNDPTFGPTPSWYNPNVVTEPTLAQMAANGRPACLAIWDATCSPVPAAITGTWRCSRTFNCLGSIPNTPPCSSAWRPSTPSSTLSGKRSTRVAAGLPTTTARPPGAGLVAGILTIWASAK